MDARNPWLGDVETSALETKTFRVTVTIVIVGEPSSTGRLRCGVARSHHDRGKGDISRSLALGLVNKMRRDG